MSNKDYVADSIVQVLMVSIAIAISFVMFSAYQNLTPEEIDRVIIYLMLMG